MKEHRLVIVEVSNEMYLAAKRLDEDGKMRLRLLDIDPAKISKTFTLNTSTGAWESEETKT